MHSEPPSQSDTSAGPDESGPPASSSPGDGEAVSAISSPSLGSSGEAKGTGPGGTLRSGSASAPEVVSDGASDAPAGPAALAGAASTVRFGVAAGEGARAAGEGSDELVGQVVSGRWKVTRLLGQGGMGAVYEAQNVAIGKRVALKFIVAEAATDPEVVSRFQREAEAASAVESAHIVEVFDTGTSERGLPYLVMELLRGESLGARLRRAGKLPPAEAVHIVAQALRGLSRAHAAGVIHRDLKPDNVFLVDRDDDPLFVKILDFGISKIARRPGEVGVGTLTRKGTVLGTPYYMSPEQAQAHGDLDERTDIFSMGAILFECLTGRAPCAGLGTYEAVIVAICSRDAPDVRSLEPGVPAPLAAVVARALARDRDARFPSAAAFFESLRDAMPGVVSSRGPSPGGPATPAPQAIEQGAAGQGPSTRTSWTSRGGSPAAPITPTLRAPDGHRSGLRRLLLLGGGTAALAFVATLALMRLGSTPQPAPVASSAGRPSPPEVSLRIEAPEGARVLVGGKVVPDGIIRGPALSSQRVRVEAEGHQPLEREVLLDGRPHLKVELAPEVVPAGSAPSAPSSAGSPPASSAPAAVASSAPAGKPAGSSKGGAKKPPQSDDGGLKLKVNP